MLRISDEIGGWVVHAHIRDGCTISSLAAEHRYIQSRCFQLGTLVSRRMQNNDEWKPQLEMMEGLWRFLRETVELEKEKSF
jgi:hypothetical protein